jgi:uncharacterized protein (DUF952 family)
MLIFHITTPELWQTALNRGIYECPSLKEVGFIHCSTIEHLLDSANIHFKDVEAEELIVLHIPEKKIRQNLKWEITRNEISFPHIYSKIPIEVIQDISLLERNAEGLWVFSE